MNKPDLGAAGIAANIEYYQNQIVNKQNELQLLVNELVFWRRQNEIQTGAYA